MHRQYKKYLVTLLTKYFHPIDNLTSLNHSYLTDYQIDIVFKTAKESNSVIVNRNADEPMERGTITS